MGGIQLFGYQTLQRSSGVGLRTVALASVGLLVMVGLAALSQRLGSGAKKMIFAMIVALLLSTAAILAGDAITNSKPRTELGYSIRSLS